MITDTKFFTNEDNNSLLERFKTTLATTRYFDVLVGYFRCSGFGLLSDALGNVEKMRILVGLETEKSVVNAALGAETILPELCSSHAEIHGQYSRSVQHEFENAPEEQRTEDSIAQFMDFIRAGKIEIRGHPSRDIHAKVYISRYWDDRDFGNVVTGSSNFSNSGLTAQREFNVQLKDEGDVKFALGRFEKLWNESVELTDEFMDTAARKTWLNNSITPYELYLKFLYEYFKEDINITDGISAMLPEKFQNLEYQRQAVIAARKILDMHNGVFLSDVVGLGKTFIAAMLLQGLPGHKLIICPPVLKPYWEEALRTFYVHPFKVESNCKLSEIADTAKYSYVVVDESHRFRNEKTQSYELLKRICLGKKIILLSATPLNNKLDDLLAQIKLFQKGQASTIPGIPNLEAFFRQQAKILKDLKPSDKADRIQAERIASLVRDKVLKHVMIRRTRKEVSKYFSEDISKNGLEFPNVENPTPLVYEFDDFLNLAFDETISLLKEIRYARYSPLLYLENEISQIETLSQNNIRGFIKSLLVKRLESSFHAFGLTVERIIYSCEAFIESFMQGKVYIGKQVDMGEIIDSGDWEDMEEKLLQKGVEIYNASDFAGQLLPDLQNDLAAFHKIAAIWSKITVDPKFDAFFTHLCTDENLKDERILVFTESRETGEYIYSRLQELWPGRAMMFSSKNALRDGKVIPSRDARNSIKRNFDPASDDPGEDFRILITTDVLAEGMNLHRAGRIINYDLPWNPTRVMQRLGRINRVGTDHKKLYIFNFFPTAQADIHLGLQDNITKKITAFNSVLGSDNKILFEEENPDPHGLFRKLAYIGEEEDEDSELEYLREIREIRDRQPKLFEKIKRLPPKARSAYAAPAFADELLIFFREGFLKKFVACGTEIRELTFLEAAPLMRAGRDAKRARLPADYYSRLQSARKFLDGEAEGEMLPPRANSQNKRLLESISFLRGLPELTDEEQDYLALLYQAVSQSALAKKSIKRLGDICKRSHPSPLALFSALREAMPPKDLKGAEEDAKPRVTPASKQVVLCQYIAPAQGEIA